jgi:hypothetical protein
MTEVVVFLFAGADKTSNCSKLMNTFTEVCSQLGVPIADDKTEGPSTRITKPNSPWVDICQ